MTHTQIRTGFLLYYIEQAMASRVPDVGWDVKTSVTITFRSVIYFNDGVKLKSSVEIQIRWTPRLILSATDSLLGIL
jgi:hypothetical protein